MREPFAIGKYEVTVEEFERFVDHTRYRTEARREHGCGAPTTPDHAGAIPDSDGTDRAIARTTVTPSLA